jgi:beta-glucosidase
VRRTSVAGIVLVCLVAIGLGPVPASTQGGDVERKIDALIARMTVAEKFGQLQQLDGMAEGVYRPEHPDMVRKGLLGSTLNVRGAKTTNDLQRVAVEESRLKIPLLFGFDVIHGYRTIFPVPLAMASSWDPAAVERAASIAADETSASGVKWTFSPMVDVARDPRWGRVVEGAGEDTYLGSVMARAQVVGYQGADYSAPNKVMACAKHWVAYGAAEGGRDYNTTDVTERALREIYFPPFKAAIDAGVPTFMSAFNDVDGVPATANEFTLQKVLRDEWKFDGFVVSDYTSVMELTRHGIAADEAEAAQLALGAGVDMEMVSRFYNAHGAALLRDGRLTETQLNEAVRRILRIKFRLGLFDRPYADPAREQRAILTAANRAAAREIAARSMVLLENDGGVLPLSKDVRTVAVIGPLADSQIDMIGSWSGDGRKEDAVTVLTGIKGKVASNTRVVYAKGCDVDGPTEAATASIAEAVAAARGADVAILVVGESAEMSGEAAARSSLDIPGAQLELVKAVRATGKPTVVVLMNGRPLTIGWIAENCPAVLETWFSGTEGGNAIADVLFGDVNPGGKLPMTFPRVVGQVPIYYNHKNTGRPFSATDRYTSKYRDLGPTPQYPFGYGLSYTTFEYANLKLDRSSIKAGEPVKVTVDVRNTGRRPGDEVVQLYVSDVAASVTRPVKQLRGFQRVTIAPGETRTLSFTLDDDDLGMYGRDLRWVVEPGAFDVMVGGDSATGLKARLMVGR